jgi:heat shock protein HslJ
MSRSRILVTITVGLVLAACGRPDGAEPRSEPGGAQPAVPDKSTSRLALDWAGTYEGVLPCADCAGIRTRLTLGSDGTFAMQSLRLQPDADAASAAGRFSWLPDGNSIVLEGAGDRRRFQVGEGRLFVLNDDGSRPGPDAPGGSLARLTEAQAAGDAVSAQLLVDHHWRLESAVTAGGQRIDALLPAERPFEFRFEPDRFMAKGGCNGLRGGYQLDADGRLVAGAMTATLMACEPALMDADRALAAVLAAPARAVLVRGPDPTVALVSADGSALMLVGRKTPEALYGPPTGVFLEVAARTVPCPEPDASAQCLSVREIRFDERGLRSGEPGEWQVFTGTIEGYTHEPGTRNVVRVNRYQPAGDAEPVHVLDLVVESEIVRD